MSEMKVPSGPPGTSWPSDYLGVLQYLDVQNADTRTRHMPLLHSPYPVITIIMLYLGMARYGGTWMRHRRALSLTPLMLLYNISLAILSLYMFIEILLSTTAAGYNWICQPYVVSYDAKEMRVINVLWWYYFSKLPELLDTALMVLRKRNRQITFLHVFHHAFMFPCWYYVMLAGPGAISFFAALLNSAVHVLMYTYYGLSTIPALRPYLGWKRYLTTLQLIQFGIVLVHTLNLLHSGCAYPPTISWILVAFMLSMIVLFGNFYARAYSSVGPPPPPRVTASNGTTHHPAAAAANGECNGATVTAAGASITRRSSAATKQD